MSENDVKIYVSKKELNNGADLAGAFDSVIVQRVNGNLDKAKKLGETLATITPTGEEGLVVKVKEHLAPRYFVQDILYQIKVLLVFACETIIQLECPGEIVSAAAIASMYEGIQKTSPGFYKNISNGAAFTFYYLAIQKGGDVSDNIGEAFAMLCSVKNKDGFIDAGKTVWNLAVDVISKEIEKIGFLNN